MGKSLSRLIISFMIVGIIVVSSAFANGKIAGKVTDESTGNPLPGANLYIEELSLGTATDLEGNYMLLNVPDGDYEIVISYIGYEQKRVIIKVTDKITIQDISLNHQTIQGEEVVVTGQAKGQMSAINQQISSDVMKNVVAAEKIQELPEANAAEAVGRLPGVSLERSGGEGAKVIIRGLASEFNKIQIEGVDMAATSSDDRSSDLSMISPYMLEGIELTKAAMANQDANQIGGTVNFKIREADTKPRLSVIGQGGYNGLREEFGDSKYVISGSRRFFKNLFGIYANVDFENRNRSSNSVSAGYDYSVQDSISRISSLSVNDITRKNKRMGGTLVLDFKTPTTKIKFSNVVSSINTDYSYISDVTAGLLTGGNRDHTMTWSESDMSIMTNALKIEKYLGQIKLNAGVSYSLSETDVPEELSYSAGARKSAMDNWIPNKNTKPTEVQKHYVEDANPTLSTLYDNDSFTRESEFSTDFNVEWEWNIARSLKIKFDTGLKFKEKNKKYDYNTWLFELGNVKQAAFTALIENYEEMRDYFDGSYFSYKPFIDDDYDPGDFMNGKYDLIDPPKVDFGKEIIHFLQDTLGVIEGQHSNPEAFCRNWQGSKGNDYRGREEYSAAYFMPTVYIGQKLTIIPGIRYEKNKTAYHGKRGNSHLSAQNTLFYSHYDTVVHRTNEYYLPMIHAKLKPLDWFDIRASYTKTLSRPSYSSFIPRWDAAQQSMSYNNPHLKPAQSTNIDLNLSVYNDKIGLFSFGGFYKEIEDFVMPYSEVIIDKEMAVDKYGLEDKYLKYTTADRYVKKIIYSNVNNPHKAYVNGIETEWQSNFWFLPGLLKNIVLNVNYTRTFSETKYPMTIPIVEWIQGPFGGKQPVIVGNQDTTYTARLLYQPDNIVNLTIGYDYKDFSIRASMQYTSDIFTGNAIRPENRTDSDELYLYDLSLKQKLPVKGLVLFANFKNLSKSMERSINRGSGKYSHEAFYGMTADFGIRYDF